MLAPLPSTLSSGRELTPWALKVALLAMAAVFLGSAACAQKTETEPENYKLRVDGLFWYATPVASLSGSARQVPIDFNKSFCFSSYSTFYGGVDYHFRTKHHLLFFVSPNQVSRTSVLQQTITFGDQTFLAGSSVNTTLRTYSYTPGYRYDVIRRPWGHIAIVGQMNLLDIKATIKATALRPGSTQVASATGSLFTPLPVLGPEGRYYFAKNRAFVDANIKGMSFFGYGNFFSTQVTGGVKLSHKLDFVGGYQVGSHLAVNGSGKRIDVRLTQRGPTAGLEYTF